MPSENRPQRPRSLSPRGVRHRNTCGRKARGDDRCKPLRQHLGRVIGCLNRWQRQQTEMTHGQPKLARAQLALAGLQQRSMATVDVDRTLRALPKINRGDQGAIAWAE